MRRPGRVLVVDDNRRWREELAEALDRAGFHVATAATTEEAFALLAEQLYHVLILDIRMVDNDATNVEGMSTLQRLRELRLDKALRIVMLSAHGTPAHMRVSFRDYNVADFLAKDEFSVQLLIDTIGRLFSAPADNPQARFINLELDIHWQNQGGGEQAVVGTEFDQVRIKRNATALIVRAASELDDLLCRLFAGASKLLVGPLTPGHSGAGVLRAVPFYDGGGGKAWVVKYGDAGKIAREHANYASFVEPFVGDGRSTNASRTAYTPRLGGICYSLLGASDEQLQDFGVFFASASTERVIAVIDNLFLQTCAAWYANTSRLQPLDLKAEYERTLTLNRDKLELALADQLKNVQGKQKLQFRALQHDRSFTNPIAALDNLQAMRSTYVCTTHGDFNAHNILIDNTGHTWLIDFFRTGPGHILRDVAHLDAVVRIELLREEVPLSERLIMEELLASANHYSQLAELLDHVPSDHPALARAYRTAIHLRTIARRLMPLNSNDDMTEFYIASLYHSLNLVRFYWLPTVSREHALLSAALIAERLGL